MDSSNNQSKDNPYLAPPEDPYKKEKIKANLLREEMIGFQSDCFETFLGSFEPGKRLMEKLKASYLCKSLYQPINPNVEALSVYWSGWRDCIIGLLENGHAHLSRMNRGNQ